MEITAKSTSPWNKGLLDTLWYNRRMLFNPKYGRIGMVSIPYHWIFELLAPALEVVGWVSMVAAECMGILSHHFFIRFLLIGYFFSTFISIGSILIEEMTYRRYNDWRDLGRLICFCFLEHFPYRQCHTIWRLRGLWQYMRGDHAWGKIERAGIGQHQKVVGAVPKLG